MTRRTLHRAGRLMKQGVVGLVAGILMFVLFGFFTGRTSAANNDLDVEFLQLFVCAAVGIVAAISIMAAHERMIHRQ